MRITLTSIRTPRKFFEEIKGEGKNYSKPFVYMLISNLVYILGFLLVFFFLGKPSNVINKLYEIFKSLAELSIIILILVFIFIALVHFTIEIMGGKSKFNKTFKVICYSFSPLNFALIITVALLATLHFKNFMAQLMGALLALILLAVALYILYMFAVGVSVTSKISRKRAFVAVIIQLFIIVLIIMTISYINFFLYHYSTNTPSGNSFTPYPIEEKQIEWIEIGPYDFVKNHVEIAGKIVFVCETNCNDFIVYNGKEGTHYDKIENLWNINGKIAFNAMKNGKWVFVYDWNESGMMYDKIGNPVEIGEKIAYLAQNNGKNILVYDGKEIGTQYDGIESYSPVNIGDKLTYIAERNGTNIIVHDAKEIGTQYDAVWFPIDIGGSLTYKAKKNGNWFIVSNGKEMGGKYQDINYIMEIGGNLTYIAQNGSNNVLVSNGKEEKESDLIWELMNIGGKIAYMGLDSNDKWFVFYDGNKGKSYDSIEHLTEIRGKPAYSVRDNRKGFIVYNGKEIGTQYDYADKDFIDINGTLAYTAIKDGVYFVVYGEKEVGKQYDHASSPSNVSGRLAYIARTGNSVFFVYDGEEIGSQNNYDDVKDLTEVNGKKVYMAAKNRKWFIVMEKYKGLEIEPYQTIGLSKTLKEKEDFLLVEEWHSTEGHIISGSRDDIPYRAIDFPMYSIREGSKKIWIPFIRDDLKCLSNVSIIFGYGVSLDGDIGMGISSSLSTYEEFPLHINRSVYSIDIISIDRVLINNNIEIPPGGQHLIISNYTENYGNTIVQIQHTTRIKNYGKYPKDAFQR